MPVSDNFLFDLAGNFLSGISVDIRTVLAALLLFGFIIFGFLLLQSLFYGRDSDDSDSSVDFRRFSDSDKEHRRSYFDDDHKNNRPSRG